MIHDSSPLAGRGHARRASGSSLPPSSPPPPFSDTEDSLDERDAVLDIDDDVNEEEGEGEDLFGETLEQYEFFFIFRYILDTKLNNFIGIMQKIID